MKLYVLIRKDLSTSQQAVQGGHAVAEYCRHYPNSDWGYRSLVYLAVENEYELEDWLKIFKSNKDEFAQFNEPWWDNSLTAVAVLGTDSVKTLVKDLKLI